MIGEPYCGNRSPHDAHGTGNGRWCAGAGPTKFPVPDADPDTPTADAPAGTDLRELIARTIKTTSYVMAGKPHRYSEACSQCITDALLPLVRAQVEAARRDALNQAADEIAASFPPNGELRPDGTADPQAAAYVEGLRDGWSIVRDRAARGETRQP